MPRARELCCGLYRQDCEDYSMSKPYEYSDGVSVRYEEGKLVEVCVSIPESGVTIQAAMIDGKWRKRIEMLTGLNCGDCILKVNQDGSPIDQEDYEWNQSLRARRSADPT